MNRSLLYGVILSAEDELVLFVLDRDARYKRRFQFSLRSFKLDPIWVDGHFHSLWYGDRSFSYS
jgi:hypothetical protein